jgi:hypothetical protein
MRIHAIETGTVAITESWRRGKGHGSVRLLNALHDRRWTEPLLSYPWVVKQPEGVSTVGTGETARAMQEPVPTNRSSWCSTGRAGMPHSVCACPTISICSSCRRILLNSNQPSICGR